MFYYFAGYELYFSVFLAIDSLCNTLKEAQAMPMIMIQLIPLAMMVFVVRDPRQYDSSNHVLIPPIHTLPYD